MLMVLIQKKQHVFFVKRSFGIGALTLMEIMIAHIIYGEIGLAINALKNAKCIN